MKKTKFLGLLIAACAAVSSYAQQPGGDQVLLEGNNIRITMNDLLADLQQRVDPALHPEVLANEPVVRQVISNLYVYRTLAQKAKEQGLDKDPVIQARVQLFQERFLGSVWLNDFDAKQALDDKAITAQALNTYKAQPERFISNPEQVKARHILLTDKSPEGKAKAQDLLKQLKAGADFAEMAKKESADPGSAVRGGDLGAFGRGKMVPEFEEAVFALKNAGDFAEVVESQFGLHIIQLEEHIPQKTLSFAEVSDKLEAEIKTAKRNEARVEAAEKIRAMATYNEKLINSLVEENTKKINKD